MGALKFTGSLCGSCSKWGTIGLQGDGHESMGSPLRAFEKGQILRYAHVALAAATHFLAMLLILKSLHDPESFVHEDLVLAQAVLAVWNSYLWV